MKRRAVLIDRDGVINGMHYDPEHGLIDSPNHPDQFHLLPGVGAAIARLNELGFVTAVVSNQPGLAKGKMTRDVLDRITAKMLAGLRADGARVDGVYYCLHHPDARLPEYRIACECRKPRAGLLLQAAEELDLDLSASYMIGDGITDVQAGLAAGCTSIWIGRWKCDNCQAMEREGAVPHHAAQDLPQAVQLILTMEGLFDGNLPGHVQNSRN